MDISDTTLDDLLELLADKIAARLNGGTVTAKSGGAAPETTPPAVDDGSADDAPTGDSPADEVEPSEDDGEADEDLVTQEQLKFVDDNFDKKSAEEMRTELAEFYESYGDKPEDVAKEIADLKGKELTNSYKDYLARLVMHTDDGEIDDFLQDWEEPYRAERLYGGEKKFVWVKGGLTLTEDEAEAADLGDPTPAEDEPEPERKPPSRTRKPKGRKKK